MGNSFSTKSKDDPMRNATEVQFIAQGYDVMMHRNFTSIERRFVAQLDYPKMSRGRQLRTVMENGTDEEPDHAVNVSETQSLATYAQEQLITNKDLQIQEQLIPANKLKETPYVYEISDDKVNHGLLQIWTLKCDEGFEQRCTIFRNVDDNDLENDIRKLEEKYNREKNNGVVESVQVDAATSMAMKDVRGRAEHFKTAATTILGVPPRCIKYCLLETRVEFPMYVGEVSCLYNFLQSKFVQEFLEIEKVDIDNKSITVRTEDKKGNVGSKTFQMAALGSDFVVYKRQGYTTFTCIKSLTQFLKEAKLDSDDLTDTCKDVDEFLRKAKPKGDCGEGTFGTVNKYQLGFHFYALKKVKPGVTDEAVKEFAALRLMQHHPHPNLIRIHLLDSKDSQKRFVMECGLCDLGIGITQKTPTANEKLAWLGGVFLGLERLHKLEPYVVVHRDMKPENVIISPNRYAKIVDYGCSRMSEEVKRATYNHPIGTSGYMAPELLRVEPHGMPVDLYAFGGIVYFVLTGSPPPGDETKTNHDKDLHAQDHPKFRGLLEELEKQNTDTSSWWNLAKQLTETEPEKRIMHEAIRAHPFMKSLNLPEYKEKLEGAQLAQKWLVHMSHSQVDAPQVDAPQAATVAS